MLGMSPMSGGAAESEVFALFRFLTDAPACEARAKELQTISADAQAKTDALNLSRVASEQASADAAKAWTAADQLKTAADEATATASRDRAAADQRIRDAEKASTKAAIDQKATADDAANWGAKLDDREKKIAQRESNLKDAEAKVQADQAVLDEKLTLLRK